MTYKNKNKKWIYKNKYKAWLYKNKKWIYKKEL